MKYKLMKNPNQVTRVEDGASIPFDPANTDYQEYLKWLEAGNTPLPVDAQPE
jgi:hypothetical protein